LRHWVCAPIGTRTGWPSGAGGLEGGAEARTDHPPGPARAGVKDEIQSGFPHCSLCKMKNPRFNFYFLVGRVSGKAFTFHYSPPGRCRVPPGRLPAGHPRHRWALESQQLMPIRPASSTSAGRRLWPVWPCALWDLYSGGCLADRLLDSGPVGLHGPHSLLGRRGPTYEPIA
jgi:hypothetical protein